MRIMTHGGCSTSTHAVAVCVLMAMLAVFGIGCGEAMAQNRQSVYIPMILDSEAKRIKTTACLGVTERSYTQSDWWKDLRGNEDAPERAFKSVMAAMKSKDQGKCLICLTQPWVEIQSVSASKPQPSFSSST